MTAMQILFQISIILLTVLSSRLDLSSQTNPLDQYIDMAINQNLSIKGAYLNTEKGRSQKLQSDKLWNPQIDLNSSYLLARGGRVLIFPIGDLFNPTYETLNTLTGTQSFPTNLENERIQLIPNNFLDAQLSISKPLINSNIKYNQLISQELVGLTAMDEQIAKRDLIFQVKTAYYNILKSHQGKKILKENMSLLKELLDFNKTLVKYDKATTNVVTDVEFQMANLDQELALIEEQQRLAESFFNLLLDRNLSEPIDLDTTLVFSLNKLTNNLTELQQKAKANRIEYDQISVAEKINALTNDRIDKSNNPTLGVTAGIGYQSEDFNFDLGGPLYTLGLGLSWKIADGGTRKEKMQELKIEQQILENNKAQLDKKIEIDVLQAYIGLNSLGVQLNTQNVAIASARRTYEIVKSRYDNDNALLIELLQSQNQLSTAKLSKVLLEYDYLSQLAKLDKELSR